MQTDRRKQNDDGRQCEGYLHLLQLKARVSRWKRILSYPRQTKASFPVYLDYPERDGKGSTAKTRAGEVGFRSRIITEMELKRRGYEPWLTCGVEPFLREGELPPSAAWPENKVGW